MSWSRIARDCEAVANNDLLQRHASHLQSITAAFVSHATQGAPNVLAFGSGAVPASLPLGGRFLEVRCATEPVAEWNAVLAGRIWAEADVLVAADVEASLDLAGSCYTATLADRRLFGLLAPSVPEDGHPVVSGPVSLQRLTMTQGAAPSVADTLSERDLAAAHQWGLARHAQSVLRAINHGLSGAEQTLEARQGFVQRRRAAAEATLVLTETAKLRLAEACRIFAGAIRPQPLEFEGGGLVSKSADPSAAETPLHASILANSLQPDDMEEASFNAAGDGITGAFGSRRYTVRVSDQRRDSIQAGFRKAATQLVTRRKRKLAAYGERLGLWVTDAMHTRLNPGMTADEPPISVEQALRSADESARGFDLVFTGHEEITEQGLGSIFSDAQRLAGELMRPVMIPLAILFSAGLLDTGIRKYVPATTAAIALLFIIVLFFRAPTRRKGRLDKIKIEKAAKMQEEVRTLLDRTVGDLGRRLKDAERDFCDRLLTHYLQAIEQQATRQLAGQRRRITDLDQLVSAITRETAALQRFSPLRSEVDRLSNELAALERSLPRNPM